MLITDIYLCSCLSSKKFKIDFKKGIPIWPYHKSNQEDTSRVWLFLP